MSDYNLQLTALADPMRQTILTQLLVERATVADLTRALPISQPAVSQHMKILREAEIVVGQTRGRATYYEINPTGLSPLRDWLTQFWGAQLDAFKTAAEAAETGEAKP